MGNRFPERDERAVGCLQTVDTGPISRLPHADATTHEDEMHAGITGRFHMRPLCSRPVRVVASRDEDLVILLGEDSENSTSFLDTATCARLAKIARQIYQRVEFASASVLRALFNRSAPPSLCSGFNQLLAITALGRSENVERVVQESACRSQSRQRVGF